MTLFRGALFFVLVVCPAAFGADVGHKRAELKQQQLDIRNRIDQLKNELAKSEASKTDAADQLRDAELAISVANRKLRELGDNRAAVQEQLNDLERQSQQLSIQIGGQQDQLSHLLYQQFVHGNRDALQLLLSGEDPNQSARDRYFLTLLSREKATLLENMRGSLQQKKRLADAARDKNQDLAVIETQQQQARTVLLGRQKDRQAMLVQIASRIKTQQKQIDTLKGNEKRLSRLIDGLARLAIRPKSRKRNHAVEPPKKGRPAVEPDLADISGEFASLRGKLKLPVRGDVSARFGSPRGENATTWKGVFIRATEGADVHAVADGTVVYADWLRGFGNLIIVDHGDDFLSVYGNNQSLLRESGVEVKAGEAIASVGASGGNEESGLYFELRHQGRPFDPLKWIGPR